MVNPDYICLQCKKREKRKEYQFCSSQCTKDAAQRAPKLLKIPQTHVMFKKVRESFNSEWKGVPLVAKAQKLRRPPKISAIYLITWTAKLRSSFDNYRDCVGLLTGTTECKRFRSEKRACNLGEPGCRELCQQNACHLCPAIRTGFKSSLDYKRTIFGTGIRLGQGIYTTPSSSKAYQYAENVGPAVGSDTKAVLYTRVVLGKQFRTKHEDDSLRNAPSGYHSVIGITGKDSEFLDEECVVYDENAIQPAYLIMLK